MDNIVTFKNKTLTIDFLIYDGIEVEEALLNQIGANITFEFYERLLEYEKSCMNVEVTDQLIGDMYDDFCDIDIDNDPIVLVTHDNISISINKKVGLTEYIICCVVRSMLNFIREQRDEMNNFLIIKGLSICKSFF